MSALSTILISMLGGILPALLWLWFWLKEDRLHPEPKIRIVFVFIIGMLSVFIVLPLEKLAFALTMQQITTFTILIWALIEEVCKYLSAYISSLKKSDMDEPIDAVIYMITSALGFSALENTLFISKLIDTRLFSESIITGNSRFLGATLLHVASSAIIGVFMAFAYYKKPKIKKIFLFTGLLLATILHTIFNLLIIKLENERFFVFAGVWVLIISIILIIEKVKKVKS